MTPVWSLGPEWNDYLIRNYSDDMPKGFTREDFKLHKNRIDGNMPLTQENIERVGPEVESHFKLGAMYGRGEGVKSNPREAMYCFRKAAKLGHPKAQYIVGMDYIEQPSVSLSKRDFDEAAEWLRKSANQGHAKAKKALKEDERLPKPPPPDIAETVYKNTKPTSDPFEKDRQLIGPPRLFDGQRTHAFGIKPVTMPGFGGGEIVIKTIVYEGYFLRSIGPNLVQFYICTTGSDWRNFSGASAIGGDTFRFHRIQNEVVTNRNSYTGGNFYDAVEIVGVSVPVERLRKHSGKYRFIFRLNGQRANQTIDVPPHYIQGYLKAHDEFYKK
jgi:TPR repeat protein